MKNSDQCESLAEIRECIDQIDKEIIDSLALRATYVKVASTFKRSIDEVKASDRVLSMIEKRRSWAELAGINPDFVENLFRKIVSFFINSETKEWMKENNAGTELSITEADISDAQSILSLQKRAYIQEAEHPGNGFSIQPMIETISEARKDFGMYTILKATVNDTIVGSVRARLLEDNNYYIGRLMVEPIFQGKGYGSVLLSAIESKFPGAKSFELFTGEASTENIRFYNKRGYEIFEKFEGPGGLKFVKMRKVKTSF